MRKPTVECALLAALIAKHAWGTPIDEEALLAIAAVESHEYPAARSAFADLRSEPYVADEGPRGIRLDNASFGALADVLYHECGWEAYEIRIRLKHYEGWNRHEWA